MQNRKIYCKCGKLLCKRADYYKYKQCIKCYYKSLQKKYKGKNNPNYKSGKSLKKYYCINCNKELNKTAFFQKTKRCNNCYHIYLSKKFIGKGNPNYKHGKCHDPYGSQWCNNKKENIRKRDKYKCKLCNISQKEYKKKHKKVLDIHHIDYDKKNCEDTNLCSLCHKCNMKVNSNRKYWKQKLKKLI